ncbi:hypothetical protein DVH24_002341 [Malus domestica]|uniref:Uncharacterized protein n=1 Tax=Malus domestica TaxID=3750 RepID=A0A498ICG0_MALDO|nr:hypothetical protein DVH24_002341 [Malus domestica]
MELLSSLSLLDHLWSPNHQHSTG